MDANFEADRGNVLLYRQPHILRASTELLGICFVIIGALKLSALDPHSYADEIAWVSAFSLFVSTTFSYLVIRNGGTRVWQATVADYSFIAGVFVLGASMVVGAIYL